MEPTIKLRVKEIAESKGIGQKDLIQMSGVTQQLMHRYWHNYVQSVSFEQLARIAIALQVQPGDLIGFVENTPV